MTAELFWDAHCGGPANTLLVETAGPLHPGAALDLGCGAGGDTIWLARQGWQVTAVDISTTAVERVRQRARELGLGSRVVTERTTWSEPSRTGNSTSASGSIGTGGFPSPSAAANDSRQAW